MPFKVGDRLIAKTGWGADTPVGATVIVHEIVNSGLRGFKFKYGDLVPQWVFGENECHFEHATSLDERIKACLEKRRARKPVFDRSTWRPRKGDKVRVLVTCTRGLNTYAAGEILTLDQENDPAPYLTNVHGARRCAMLSDLEPA